MTSPTSVETSRLDLYVAVYTLTYLRVAAFVWMLLVAIGLVFGLGGALLLTDGGIETTLIFHEAAIASVARSLLEPRLTNDVNTNGTIEVMRAAARNGVRKVVFAGSSAVRTPSLPSPATPHHSCSGSCPKSRL